jgi:hypothetical protein
VRRELLVQRVGGEVVARLDLQEVEIGMALGGEAEAREEVLGGDAPGDGAGERAPPPREACRRG